MSKSDESYELLLQGELTSPAKAAAYLQAVVELDDADALLLALRDVARAHGIAEITRQSGLGEKSLFRALNQGGNPTLSTLRAVLRALGLRLSIVPIAGRRAQRRTHDANHA